MDLSIVPNFQINLTVAMSSFLQSVAHIFRDVRTIKKSCPVSIAGQPKIVPRSFLTGIFSSLAVLDVDLQISLIIRPELKAIFRH